MADEQTNQNPLASAFDALPEPVKSWLGSEHVTYSIIQINEKIGAAGSMIQVIPRLLFRLVTKNLHPRDFINELHRQLGINLVDAKKIAQELEQIILKPVQAVLKRDAGIDVGLIYAWEPGAPPTPTTAPMPKTEKIPETKVPEIPKPAEALKPIPPKPPTETPPAVSKVEPFILHEEPSAVRAAELKEIPRPPLTFRPTPSITPKPSPQKPVTVKLESGGKPEPEKNNKQRVVHYSNFRSPLS